MTSIAKANLLIFIKNPKAGRVKTRLAASIGDAEALKVYKRLLQHVNEQTLQLDVDKKLYYSDFVDWLDEWDDNRYAKLQQSGKDLGERMEKAFHQAFLERKKGSTQLALSTEPRPTIIIGSDCPQLTQQDLEQAFESLQQCDMVIGPAEDGGYYLLGLNFHQADLFKGIAWSTEQVFEQTMQVAAQLGLKVTVLPTLRDLDTVEDLLALGF